MSAMLCLLSALTAVIELQPEPQSAYLLERRLFALDHSIAVVVDDNATREDLAPLEPLFEALGFTPAIAPASRFDVGRRAIYIGEATVNRAFTHRSLRRYVVDPSRSRPGAYHLYIRRNGIILSGVDRAGMLSGVQTLIQMINSSRKAGLNHRGVLAVPQAEIHDAPDLPLRAIHARAPLSKSRLQAYAALKCNMIIFESNDFYNLTPERAALWRRMFEDARRLGIMAVPVFEPLRAAEALLRNQPAAVEGRSRIDRIVLHDDDWAAFTKRNIILTAESPVRVSAGNVPMRLRHDYLLSEGGLEAPFLESYSAPWMIRRLPYGNISHGETVMLTYSYAPPSSNALCPRAPETRAVLYEALDTLIRELRPPYIHGGFGDVTRLNQDLRCRDAGTDNARAFADMITTMRGIIADIRAETGMMVWADALLPPPPELRDHPESLHHAVEHLPGELLVVARLDAAMLSDTAYVEDILAWMNTRTLPPYVAVTGDAPDVYRLTGILAQYTEQMPGLIIMDAELYPGAAQAGLDRAWSLDSPRLPWPEILNGFFETSLWQPDFDEVKAAQTAYIEKRILEGVSPNTLREQYEAVSRRGPRDDEALRMASSLFEQLVRYLELEFAFATGDERSALRELAQVVRRYAALDPGLDADRAKRIMDTVQEQQLFVPAPILFGQPLAYYRPSTPAAGKHAYEIPARVEYADDKGQSEAKLDFLAQCGEIFRVDFETVNAHAVTVETSDDGVAFRTVEGRTLRAGNSQRGPFIFQQPTAARYLRLRVKAHGEDAVLREVRAFALKAQPRATCPFITGGEGASLTWPEGERVTGFLHIDGGRMAVAPTEIRLARNHTHLLIGIIAQDPMPHAVGAAMTQHDAPLWEEESVEIRLRPAGRSARRFLVNPLGARHDGMAVAANLDQWDAGWDGDWRVMAERTDTGWSATLMLPFAILGGAPDSGARWSANFLRHRNNVERECSIWAPGDAGHTLSYGTLVFE